MTTAAATLARRVADRADTWTGNVEVLLPGRSWLCRRRRLHLRRRLRRRGAQALVDRFDEHVRRIRRRRVEAVVVTRQLCGFDLIEREASLDRILHAVADDRDHVAIIGDVG